MDCPFSLTRGWQATDKDEIMMDGCASEHKMTLQQRIYRLVGLDGYPHPVLDAPYESVEAALGAAKSWCSGQGLTCSIAERGIGIEVMTSSGSWRTIKYPLHSLKVAFAK